MAPRRAIVRRETGQTHREMPTWMAKECGIDTRRTGNLVRPGSVRKGKKRSKEDLVEQGRSRGRSRSKPVLSSLERALLGRLSGQTPGFDATIAALVNRHRPDAGAAPAPH
jgi:hypothetical protein